jgi:hypothetical protein
LLATVDEAEAIYKSSELTMRLDQLFPLVERLRAEAIGTPEFVLGTRAYVYKEQSAKVVAVLKIIRAAQSLSAMKLLCQSGLFIDFGITIRCINDCIDEVYFLMEEFPKTSGNVDKFVKGFFESEMTTDGYRSQTTPAVETTKIRSARVRYLKGAHDDATHKLLERLHKTVQWLRACELRGDNGNLRRPRSQFQLGGHSIRRRAAKANGVCRA